MKNPLNPLNRDKMIIEKSCTKILSVKPLNPLNRSPLNRDSLCTMVREVYNHHSLRHAAKFQNVSKFKIL